MPNKEIQLDTQQQIQNFTYGIASLLVLILGGLFWVYRNNEQRNQQLELLNTTLTITGFG